MSLFAMKLGNSLRSATLGLPRRHPWQLSTTYKHLLCVLSFALRFVVGFRKKIFSNSLSARTIVYRSLSIEYRLARIKISSMQREHAWKFVKVAQKFSFCEPAGFEKLTRCLIDGINDLNPSIVGAGRPNRRRYSPIHRSWPEQF